MMHLQFIVIRTVAVVCGLVVVLAVLRAAGGSIPDYHAFWSGVFFWAAGAAVLVVPGFLTWSVLRRHTRYAVSLAGCAAAWAVVVLVFIDSRVGAAAAFTAGMLAIFTVADHAMHRSG